MSVFPGPVNTIANATWMEPLTSVNAQRPGKEEPAAVSVTMEIANMHSLVHDLVAFPSQL